jgi:DNA-binding response OmpR family regulator
MTKSTSVLVVDDDLEIRETLDEYLSGRGIDVVLAADGAQMKTVLGERDVDLVLLDLNLPGEGGMQLLKYLRDANNTRARNVGVIILTGVGDAEDRVLGLETGADDYVVKPFGLRELLARIHSVLRRTNAAEADSETILHADRFAGWALDARDSVLKHVDGRRAELSTGELDLIKLLLERADSPVSREELLSHSSHRELEPFDRSVDVRIARLRRKIEDNPAHPQIIRTVRNIGYVLITQT